MTTFDSRYPSPPHLSYLDYQTVGIHYILEHQSTLLADDMGLGKTIQAIGAINSSGSIRDILVICPAFLRINWKREIKKWCVKNTKITIIFGRRPRPIESSKKVRVVIVSYDVLAHHRPNLDKIEWDLLVVDEAHYCKTAGTQRTAAVLGGRKRVQRKRGVKRTPPVIFEPIKSHRRLFMTGTPILNHPIDLWTLVKSLDPEGLGQSFSKFTSRYCAPRMTRWGMDYTGAAHLDELNERLKPFMLRRLKKDVLTELPPKRRQIIELPSEGFSSLIDDEFAIYDTYDTYVKEGQVKAKKDAFTELSKRRRLVAMKKVPLVVLHLKECLAQGPVVCFAHHKDVVKAIASEFRGCSIITGETPTESRQKQIDRFQSGETNLIVGNIRAMGVGISLTRSQHVVFAELDWTPANLTQAEDRCHRIGQTNPVLIQHLVLANSLDARMVKILIRKQNVISKVLDPASK